MPLTREELEARMKKVLDDNELIINGEAEEVKETKKINQSSSSSQPKKLESLSDPQK